MRPLDLAHKIIAIMAGLIAIYNFIGNAFPHLSLPTKWSELLLSLAVIFFALTTLYRERESTAGKPDRQHQEPSIPALSPPDVEILNKAKAELESLSFAQRAALRLIYQNPGIFQGVLCQRLHELGFRETGEIVRPLATETILVRLDGRSNLSPSPNAVIAKTVREFIESSDQDL